MRTSEYYARGIYSFFTGYALDAIERHHGTVEVAKEVEPELTAGRVSAEDDWGVGYDYVPESCQCSTTIYPPCSYCEPGD